MTRIGRPKLILRVLLLLSLLKEQCAFTLKTSSKSPVNARLLVGRFATSVGQDSTRNELLVSDVRQGENQLLLSATDGEATGKKMQNFQWILFLAALLQTQFFSSSSSMPGADGVALSTVSTTLLRSNHRGSRRFSTQQLLAIAVITWQVGLNLGPMLSLVQVGVSAFSTWYMGCLAAFPIYTKSLTTGVVGFLGDTGAQLLEERIRSRKEGTKFQMLDHFDRRRAIANIIDGIFVTGPLLHFAYNFLEKLIPVHGAASGLAASVAALTQVLIDDFILDAIFVGFMFVTTGVGEGYKMRDIAKQFRKDYVGAVRTSWATSVLLMPLEFILFRFFPLSVRVLGMNMIDIAWEGMVSFLVHKRRRNHTLEGEVNEMQAMLTRDHAPIPAH